MPVVSANPSPVWASQRGLTLIELLVGLVVGSFVVLGVISAWGVSVRVALYTEEAAQLNNELRSVMQMVSEDLRRADRNTVAIAPNGQCLTFNVAPPVQKAGSCDADPAADPDCWEPRGYRFQSDQFQVYLVRGATPPASCDTNANWVPLHDSLNTGSFLMADFSAACHLRCYELRADPDATIALGQTQSVERGIVLPLAPRAAGETDENFADRLAAHGAACAAVPRCDLPSRGFPEFVEVLSIDLQLSGSVSVSAQAPRALALRNTVTIRNNVVQQ
jgi:prepilin-type N-terminal cleavage/methylation domain-containing protein